MSNKTLKINKAFFIYPHQLFESKLLDAEYQIFLIEDTLFFGDKHYPLKFHKQKLFYHRVTMKTYYESLLQKGFNVVYVNYNELVKDDLFLEKILQKHKIQRLEYFELCDFILEKRLKKLTDKLKIQAREINSPGFINDINSLKYYFEDRKSFFFYSFYQEQRKKHNILLDHHRKPLGGKWSLDSENRQKIPAYVHIPELLKFRVNNIKTESEKYINKEFSSNPGFINKELYPTTHSEANDLFQNFLAIKFLDFGIYQDAIVKDQNFLFHSVISAPLNIGLLNPKDVIFNSIDFAEGNSVPLNSLEGFIRQILGWREYIRALYVFKGVKERNSNFFGNKRKIHSSFYTGDFGIEPLDNAIKRLLHSGYNHHIERLMVIGNFMLLCEIDPAEVYNWFMEMYIDAYDWVMVPNVYGMSQFADGGLISTKPYISSSNYILKMSDYKKGNWTEIWDALFWRFIYNHTNYFANNYRTRFMAKQLEKMNRSKLKSHLNTAEEFFLRFWK